MNDKKNNKQTIKQKFIKQQKCQMKNSIQKKINNIH